MAAISSAPEATAAPDLTAELAASDSAAELPPRSTAGSPDDIHPDLRYMTHDPALVNKLMKKRQEEMVRRTKILDTRRFRHGVPHDVLDKQVAEKRAKADEIKAQDAYHDHYRVVSDQVAQVCERIRQDATRERQKAVVAYSMENCRKEQRREYSLSDPNLIKTERPARDGDNDPRLGPSSVQNFEGEDFLAKDRKKEAVASTREWLAYQMAQKQEYQATEKESDRLYDEAMVTANEVRGLCEKATIETIAAEKKAEAEANKALAQVHHARKQENRMKDAKAAQSHVDYEMNSDRMMELADYKLGVDGRLMKAEYKRLSVDEEQGVYDANARLMLEKQARMRKEKSDDQLRARDGFVTDMVLYTIENEKSRRERTARKKVEEFNKVLAQEQKEFKMRERKAYRSRDHLEPYNSTANLAKSQSLPQIR